MRKAIIFRKIFIINSQTEPYQFSSYNEWACTESVSIVSFFKSHSNIEEVHKQSKIYDIKRIQILGQES